MRNDSNFDPRWLPIHLQNLIEQEIEADENIVWMDQPNPRKFMFKSLPIVLFAIPWTAFSVFWMVGAAGFKVPNFNNPESYFMLFGLPFLFIGIGMLSSPIWVARNAKRSVYLITNARVIIMDGGWTTSIRNFKPRQLQNITRHQNKNGVGDLIFAQKIAYDSEGGSKSKDIGFIAIENVKMVHQLIDELVDKAQLDTDNNWESKPIP